MNKRIVHVTKSLSRSLCRAIVIINNKELIQP